MSAYLTLDQFLTIYLLLAFWLAVRGSDADFRARWHGLSCWDWGDDIDDLTPPRTAILQATPQRGGVGTGEG